MDQRTRERLPVLPALVAAVDSRRAATARRLTAARAVGPGETFTTDGRTLRRAVTTRAPANIWAEDPDRRRPPQPHPRRKPGVLGLGRRERAAPNRRPRRRTDRVDPSQPGAIPPSPQRRTRAPAARSPRPRPTPNACSSSRPNWPTCSARSSAGSVTTLARSRWWPPTTTTNGSSTRRCRCCYNVGSAPRTARSTPRPSATSSTKRGRHRTERCRRAAAAVRPARLPQDLHHRRRDERHAPAHRPTRGRAPRPQHHHGI